MPKSSTNATMLTALFLAIMLAGFGAVAYVDYDYQLSKEPELLFTTDSSNSPNDIYIDLENYPYTTFDYVATGQIVSYGSPDYTYYTYNRTCVYSGNNTWTMSCNTTDGTTNNQARFYFELPELENWIISSINISFSTNNENDLGFAVGVDYPINHVVDYERPEKRGILIDRVYSFTPTDNHYYRNISVPLNTAIDLTDSAKNIAGTMPTFLFTMEDEDDDGMEAWAFSISMEIYGEKINTWSISDTLSVVIAGAGIVNISIAVLMLDSVDIGGYVKDIKKRRK